MTRMPDCNDMTNDTQPQGSFANAATLVCLRTPPLELNDVNALRCARASRGHLAPLGWARGHCPSCCASPGTGNVGHAAGKDFQKFLDPEEVAREVFFSRFRGRRSRPKEIEGTWDIQGTRGPPEAIYIYIYPSSGM